MAFNIVAGVNNAVYGSVSGSGSYEEGAEVTLEVTENDGYRFVEWSDGNTDNPRVFNASEDLTLMATLEAIPEYAVTLSVNNDNLGSTSGAGSYREGSVATISAVSSSHCRFVKWDDDNTDNPRTLTVNAAVTLEAIFETVNWYTITAVSSDITMGSVTGAGDYDEGETVTLTAVPNTDYRFVEWDDGNSDNPRTFTATASGSYEAVFAEIVYANVTIDVNNGELGNISGATSGSLEVGSTITITATPATDCRFLYWEISGEEYSYDNTLIFEITEDVTITAVFEAITFYQVNLITSDTEYGTIDIVAASETARGAASNIYPEDTTITVNAVPTTGGRFLNWGDGDIRTQKTFSVNGNLTIRANFYPASGLILVAAHKIQKIWTSIKSFFSAPTGASKIGVPANNALGATTLADVVNSVGQANGLAQLNEDGKINISDLGGSGAEGLDVDITGNAATATSADSAEVAEKIGTTTIGSSTEPVYINAGTPTACGGSLDIDITGNAATATDSTTVKELNGTSNYNRPILLSGLTDITTTTDNQTTPVYSNNFYANPSTGVATAVNGFSTSKSYTTSLTTSTHLAGNKGTALINSTAAKGYTMLARMKSTNGVFTHGVYNADYQFYYTADSLISAGTNNVTKTCLTINEDGTVKAPNGFIGNVTGNCSGSSGSCTGNAATATTASSVARATFGDSSNASHDCNAIKSNGLWYYSSNGPATTLGASTTDGALYSQAYSTSWCGQIAQDYRNGRLFVRGLNNGTWKAWMVILDSGNYTSYTVKKDGTGASGSWGISVTGSSASCTGNAATATSATSATTATNANNLKVTHTGAAWRDILSCATGFTSASNQAVYGHNSGSVAYYVDANATSGNQRAILRLGNATANTTAAGHNGQIWMYGTSTGYTCITPGYNSTSSVTLTLPSSTGTIALTSQIPTAGHTWNTTKAKTSDTASSTHPNVVVKTYETTQSVTVTGVTLTARKGYRKWSDGFIEEWGIWYTGTAYTLLCGGFSDTNYTVIASPKYYNNNLTHIKPMSKTQIGSEGGPSVSVAYEFYCCGY